MPTNSTQTYSFPATVGDLKKFLKDIPDDMLLFRINDYLGICEPVAMSKAPNIKTVYELEFAHGRSFHYGSRDNLIAHKVIRELAVLNVG